MTIIEYEATREDVLRIVDESIRQLQDDGAEARFIVAGPDAYVMLRKAIGERFGRGAGTFETYQYVPIVVDPFRESRVCVLPAPSEIERGVSAHRFGASES